MNLKLISLSLIVWLAGHRSFAQQNPDEILRIQKFEKYHEMENNGMTLTIVGSVLFAAGVVIHHNSSMNLMGETTGNPAMGTLCKVLGVGGLSAGILMWSVGASNRKKYSTTSGQVTVSLNANMRHQGLTFSYRF